MALENFQNWGRFFNIHHVLTGRIPMQSSFGRFPCVNILITSKEPDMNNTEKRRLILLNVELFRWCGKNPDKHKSDWNRWRQNGGDLKRIPHDCFICFIMEGGPEACEAREVTCMIDWGGQTPGCCASGSIFRKYTRASGVIRSHYANIVAETLQQVADALPEDEIVGTAMPLCFSEEAIIGKRKGIDMPVAFKPSSSSNELWEKDALNLVLARNFHERLLAFAQAVDKGACYAKKNIRSRRLRAIFREGFDPIKEVRAILAEIKEATSADK